MDKHLQNKEVENKVDKTLELAENLKKQEIKPYFYTRLMAKIEDEKSVKSHEPAFMGMSRRFAIGAVGLLLVINSLTVYFTLSSNNAGQYKENREEQIETIADEYFGGTDYYNY